MLFCACLLRWQFLADTRSTVLGSAPPCSALSKQLLWSHFPLSYFAENNHHDRVSRSESTLSINSCARSFHCVPPDALSSFPTALYALGRWPLWTDPHFLAFFFWVGSPSEETGPRVSLFQHVVCSPTRTWNDTLLNPVLFLKATPFLCDDFIFGVSLSFPATQHWLEASLVALDVLRK